MFWVVAGIVFSFLERSLVCLDSGEQSGHAEFPLPEWKEKLRSYSQSASKNLNLPVAVYLMGYLYAFHRGNICRSLFFISAALMLLLMLFVSGDYGINWDEKLQKEYGEKLCTFYLSGGTDTSYMAFPQGLNIHLYGGLFEVIAATLCKLVHFDEYNVRHFLNAIFGFFAILFTGLTARRVGSWRAALFALFFIYLTPVFFGHSMYNSKDIPFAAGYVIATYFMIGFIGKLPEANLRRAIYLGLGIAVALGIRVGGILLILYLGLFYAVKVIRLFYGKDASQDRELETSNGKVSRIKSSIKYVIFAALLGYFVGILFWPYGLANPLKNPSVALMKMANYSFDSYGLFEGKWIHGWEIPWYYIPKWIWITTPLFINVIFVFIPLCFLRRHKLSKESNLNYLLMVLFVTIAPVIFAILNTSNVYDGWRHFLFVYPPLVVIAALTWEVLIDMCKNVYYLKIAIICVIIFSCGEAGLWMIRNHPYESFYFSPVIGGIKGAFKKYEIDYYGTSIRSAVEWVGDNVRSSAADKKVRVRQYYGTSECSEHFIKKYDHLVYVVAYEDSLDWDYSIVLPSQAKHYHNLLWSWPPRGTVYEIKADSTPLVAIVKNYRTLGDLKMSDGAGIGERTPEYYLALSLNYYNRGQYEECVGAALDALRLKPDYDLAYNNICAAYNKLKQWDRAIEAGEKAVRLNPNNQLAKNNLAWAKSEKMKSEKVKAPTAE